MEKNEDYGGENEDGEDENEADVFVRTLDLADNRLGSKGADAIADALRVNRSLTFLSSNLSENEIAADGVIALAKGLSVNCALTEINLSNNLSTAAGMAANIRGAGGAEDAWCAIFDALRYNMCNKIATWNLRNEKISPRTARALANYVAVSSALTSLDLSNRNKQDRRSGIA